jgi:metal-responsive CopG/Arc/MetJ family transcriptional regulator
MRRATVTIPDDLAKAVDTYIDDQEAPPALTSVVQAALRQYLTQRGYLQARGALRITPASQGSGRRDVSANHDSYFAER